MHIWGKNFELKSFIFLLFFISFGILPSPSLHSPLPPPPRPFALLIFSFPSFRFEFFRNQFRNFLLVTDRHVSIFLFEHSYALFIYTIKHVVQFRTNLLMIADQKCIVGVDPQTEKRNASVPAYIPEISSLRYLLTYCLDIRRSPGRVSDLCSKFSYRLRWLRP